MTIRKDSTLTQEFRSCVEKWRKAFRQNIDQYHKFHEFVFGTQWEGDEEEVLKNFDKTPMQFNKVAPLMNHLIGEQRMNTPNLEVYPDDDTPAEEVAVRKALIKDISLDSKAKIAYQTAFQQAGVGGYGAFRIGSEYLNDKSFDQIPVIYSVRDATKCFWDLGAESISKTDGMYAGFHTKISRSLFRKKYGKKIEGSVYSKSIDDQEDTASNFEWDNDNQITVGEIYKRSLTKSKIYELSTGDTIDDEEFKKLEKIKIPKIFDGGTELDEDDDENYNEFLVYNGMPCTIKRERGIVSYKVTHYKWAGDYILEEVPFPSKQLPVIFVDQNSYFDKTGRQICRPFVKDAKDAQRFINYLGTQIAYLIKVSRYDQFMASRENVKSPKTQLIWRNPSMHQGALIYDIDKIGGSKPERLTPPELPITLLQQYDRALNDIQTSTGIYDTKVGNQGNEDSGAAIDARTRQGAFNTYIVFDSINRAIATGGEVINEMTPGLIDTQRKMTLDMPDTGPRTIILNQQADEYGTKVINDMTKGSYKVRLMPGPSYEGQKAQSLQAMGLILQAAPELFAMIADLYAKNLPTPDVVELTNRLRTMVPAEILEAGKTGKPLPPKQPQQDPALMVKMQELALKQQHLELDKQKLQAQMEQDGIDRQIKIQELEDSKAEAAAQLQQHILSYVAETHRTEADQQIAHSQNIVELLTRPNKHNTHEPKNKS